MKVVYVVDSISDLNQKITLIRNKFGDDIFYVVRADLVDFFKTYNFTPNAIYYNNLTTIIHSMLLKTTVDNVVICYASLNFNDKLLTKFVNKIGDKSKIVCLMPKYNIFEQVCNSTYNIYVKSIFKVKDSLASHKLQFIPSEMLVDLLSSHLGNRLFEMEEGMCRFVTTDENKETNKSMKATSNHLKSTLLAMIITLVITIGLIVSIAIFKPHFLVVLIFIVLYVLNFLLTTIFLCKAKFDKRFLK